MESRYTGKTNTTIIEGSVWEMQMELYTMEYIAVTGDGMPLLFKCLETDTLP